MTVVSSDLTGHPIGIESYGGAVGLLAVWTAFVVVVAVAAAVSLRAFSGLRHRWSARIAAAVAFLAGTVGLFLV
ncbi:hypothetical protein BJF78_22390 [Pseudonocardia sp. CNS-139]|nr:hypothetical protein BJF78_22390 [Pseudonocardia sp. CNS-139]